MLFILVFVAAVIFYWYKLITGTKRAKQLKKAVMMGTITKKDALLQFHKSAKYLTRTSRLIIANMIDGLE